MTTQKFWSQKLFEKRDSIKISYEGVAQKCHTTSRSAKNYIKRDLEAGLIYRERRRYIHPVFKKLCDGRNTYFLTEQGKILLGRKAKPPSSGSRDPQKPSRELLLDFSKKLQNLSSFEVEELPKEVPLWWLKDLPLLKKTLKLLHQKIKKGYKVCAPYAWISKVLKERGVGYRQKVANEVFRHLQNPEREANFPPPVQNTYALLRKFSALGLDTSISSIKKLLRKGFAHLGLALCTFDKLLQYSTDISNPSAFLNYLISLEDPIAIFSSAKTPQKIIAIAKTLLVKYQKHITFVSNPGELPESPEKGKIYLQFLVHKRSPEQSLLRSFQKSGSLWKQKVIKALDPLFLEKTQALLGT